MMRIGLAMGLAMVLGNAAVLAPMKIWPNGAPGPSAAAGEERDMTTAKDGLVAGGAVIRLGDVKTPTITVYKPATAKDTGVSVVVFPGGGYRILAAFDGTMEHSKERRPFVFRFPLRHDWRRSCSGRLRR